MSLIVCHPTIEKEGWDILLLGVRGVALVAIGISEIELDYAS